MSRPVLIAAVLLAAACESGTVQGKVVVGPGRPGLAVMAVLWQEQTQVDEAGRPQTTLVPLGHNGVGTSLPEGGEFNYFFNGLSAGRYVVGAYLDGGDDRDPTCDEHTWDVVDPVVVDPYSDDKKLVQKDIYVGRSAPGRGSIAGTVHLSAKARALPVTLFALDKPLNAADARPLAEFQLCNPLDDTPFELHNLPPGAVHLLALADTGSDDGSTDPCAEGMGNDLFAFGPNPVTVAADARATGADLWLDREAPPTRGTLAGTVELSAPLPTARVQMAVFAADPTRNADAPLAGVANLEPGSRLQVPFSISGLPLGPVYLVAFPRTREQNCRVLSGSPVYAHTRFGATPHVLGAETPAVRDIVFPIGVGRVSGKVDLMNAPASLARVFVVASQGGEPQQLDAYDGRTNAQGEFFLEYELFGLADGTFDMEVVPDVSGDGWLEDEVQSNYRFAGTPAKVTVIGGGRTGCDFFARMP